jgi:hypothetical protein
VKDHVQQGIADLKGSVVFDEPKLAELVHKKAHARSRRSHHFGERLLSNLRYDGLGPPLLAKVRHQKEQSRQTPLARIKQLVDQVRLDARVPSQDVDAATPSRNVSFGKWSRIGAARY